MGSVLYCTVQYDPHWMRRVRYEETMEPVAQGFVNSKLSVISGAELNGDTAQTPGSLRMSAISPTNGIACSMWGGIFIVEPGSETGIHHHGEQDTIVYVLEGIANVRWGQRGEYSVMVKPGDFLHVPPWIPHQEINPSPTQPFRWVVVRSSEEPIVVNLSANFWKAAAGKNNSDEKE
jgi:uncharacterized RmlC-like cupin family protein